jgi:hypothetical protein
MEKEIKLDLNIKTEKGKILNLENCLCSVQYTVQKGYPATFYDPGEPNSVSVEKVFLNDIDVTDYVNLEYVESLFDANEELEDMKANFIDSKIDELKECL